LTCLQKFSVYFAALFWQNEAKRPESPEKTAVSADRLRIRKFRAYCEESKELRKCESLVRFRALAFQPLRSRHHRRLGISGSHDPRWVCGSLRIADGGTLDASLRGSNHGRVSTSTNPHAHAPQRVEIQLGALDLPRARLPTRPGPVDDDNIAPALYMSERPWSPAPEETNSMTIDAPDALARGPGTNLGTNLGPSYVNGRYRVIAM
jgi:hypothetical protein